MKIKFLKMSGAGNDFVLAEASALRDINLKKTAIKLCDRKNGIGADGLLVVKLVSAGAISLRYFNSDGSEAFCGNGSRCAAWWAYLSGFSKKRKVILETSRGVLTACITGYEKVKMAMPVVERVSFNHKGRYPGFVTKAHFLNTGVPHAVIPVSGPEAVDVAVQGRKLRFNKAFGPGGANVNFIEAKRAGLQIRTYERGVEGETLACGTGITAAAIALGSELGLKTPVKVTAYSGAKFKVWFKATGTGFSDIYLEGPASIVFKGEIPV